MHAIELSQALAQSVRHSLEIMCFADITPAIPAPERGASKRATVPFRGGFTGTLDFAIDREAAHVLTSAFLGLAPSETPAEMYVNSTVCELGTVICGRLLSSLDPFTCLQLGKAHFTEASPENTTVPPDLRLDFDLDCGRIAVCLRLD